MSESLALAEALIARRSVTPEDAGCQDLLTGRLKPLGFHIERLPFGNVENLWAVHGTGSPLFVFAGHTDVVPSGSLDAWDSDPFTPQIRNGYLYGRGAADMKSSLAAMITACERFIAANPQHAGSVALLITSDEEGDAVDGTVRVVEWLQERDFHIDWCVVGEPTSEQVLGDVIKNGRRGSLSGKLVVHGIQGHVAYPQLAVNPIHIVAPAISVLCDETWDDGIDSFPPTTFQISNISGGTGATNVIPGTVELKFNFRFSPASTPEELRRRVENILHAHKLKFDIEWTLSAKPFLTGDGHLISVTRQAIESCTGTRCRLSTEGGTSDGRFIAPTGAQVIELGPVNSTIHKANECIAAADIDRLSAIYEKLLTILLGVR